MKRIISLCALLFTITLSILAQNEKEPVSMVSYEQSWLDMEGTIALKNNTSEEITRVCFQITYLDMENNPMDYEVFTKRINIDPGMVKKTNIPAYEHHRQYHYYKTPKGMGSPKFKIAYKFKSYNGKHKSAAKPVRENQPKPRKSVPVVAPKASSTPVQKSSVERTDTITEAGTDTENAIEETEYDDTDSYDMIYLWLVFSTIIALYIIVALMAQHRNRNAISWVLLSIVITPPVSMILLFIMGYKRKNTYYFSSTNNIR